MTKRENEMLERIYSLEGQLVKAAIMITEEMERAEVAEKALNYAMDKLSLEDREQVIAALEAKP